MSLLRSALFRARPVLAAFLPALSHGIHVFARSSTSTEWTDVKVGKRATGALLKGAVIEGLQLDVPPSRVRLHRELDGSDIPVPLDSLKKLVEQSVGEGSRVVAEVIPLPYVLVSLGSSPLTTEVVFAPDTRADALKDAIISRLKLDVPSSRLRLLRVANVSDKPLPLDSLGTLAKQGVSEGSRLVAEVIPLPYVLVSRGLSPLTTEVVFAPDTHADALKDAIISKLKLDVPSSRLQLLRVANASDKPLPLDSFGTLAKQGVSEGSRLVAEVIPLPYVLVSLGLSPLTTEVVFAPDTHADALKDAIISKLKLDTSPCRLRLLCTVSGGDKPLLLENSKTLAAQGVSEGTRVVVEGHFTPLKYFWKLPKGKLSLPSEGEFTSVSFASLLQGRILYHVRKTTNGGSRDEATIADLDQASKVCALGSNNYLVLDDFSISMNEEVREV